MPLGLLSNISAPVDRMGEVSTLSQSLNQKDVTGIELCPLVNVYDYILEGLPCQLGYGM